MALMRRSGLEMSKIKNKPTSKSKSSNARTKRNKAPRSKGPKASRPCMPGYGILDAKSGSGLLPWSVAVERLTEARNYWIATTRPDGRPHSMPVWGIWLEDRFYFSSGRQSRKIRNLAANPRCVVGAEPADKLMVVEGIAQEVTDRGLLRRFADAYAAKYEWDMEGFAEPVFVVRPTVAFAFEWGDFNGSQTRWQFEEF